MNCEALWGCGKGRGSVSRAHVVLCVCGRLRRPSLHLTHEPCHAASVNPGERVGTSAVGWAAAGAHRENARLVRAESSSSVAGSCQLLLCSLCSKAN